MAMRKKKGKNQGDLEGGGGGDGKRGFLFGGSLNPVLGIPSVNSGPISIHSAGYIAEYTCFLLLFDLSLSFSSGRAFSNALQEREFGFALARRLHSLAQVPHLFHCDAYVYTCLVYNVAPIYVSRPRTAIVVAHEYLHSAKRILRIDVKSFCGWSKKKSIVFFFMQ